jgi:hypothetical protein
MLRKPPDFSKLLNNYPTSPIGGGCSYVENSTDPDMGSCALRMSHTLNQSGFHLDNYSDTRQGGLGYCVANDMRHALRAESLRDYLTHEIGTPTVFHSPEEARPYIHDRQGIIFFKDIDDYRGGRGDHIDLWNRTSTQGGWGSDPNEFSCASQVHFWDLTPEPPQPPPWEPPPQSFMP